MPKPRITRPGASLLIVAAADAVTGAIRLLGIETSVPSLIVEVRSAASAIAAYASDQISCESGNQACVNPASSAAATSRHISI